MLLVQVNRDLMDVDGFCYWVYDKGLDLLLAEDRYATEEAYESACDDIAFELERSVIQVWDYEEGREVNHLTEIDNYSLIREFLPDYESYCEMAPM